MEFRFTFIGEEGRERKLKIICSDYLNVEKLADFLKKKFLPRDNNQEFQRFRASLRLEDKKIDLLPFELIKDAYLPNGSKVRVVNYYTEDLNKRDINKSDKDKFEELEKTPLGELRLVSSNGKLRANYYFFAGVNYIGRNTLCEIKLDFSDISDFHCKFLVKDGKIAEVEDLDSINGTFFTKNEIICSDYRFQIHFFEKQGDFVTKELGREICKNAGSETSQKTSPKTSRQLRIFERIEIKSTDQPILDSEVPKLQQNLPISKFPFISLITPLLSGLIFYLIFQNMMSIIFFAMSPLMVVGNWFQNKFSNRKQQKNELLQFQKERKDFLNALTRNQQIEIQKKPDYNYYLLLGYELKNYFQSNNLKISEQDELYQKGFYETPVYWNLESEEFKKILFISPEPLRLVQYIIINLLMRYFVEIDLEISVSSEILKENREFFESIIFFNAIKVGIVESGLIRVRLCGGNFHTEMFFGNNNKHSLHDYELIIDYSNKRILNLKERVETKLVKDFSSCGDNVKKLLVFNQQKNTRKYDLSDRFYFDDLDDLTDVIGGKKVYFPKNIKKQWGSNKNNWDELKFPIGFTGDEILYFDLIKQGPHCLIGGMTGSGKSEFMQTFLLSLMTFYSPKQVNFLLIDFKGGASFEDFESSPHCLGVLTDLNQNECHRFLHSMRAELKFREEVFRKTGVADFNQYHKTFEGGGIGVGVAEKEKSDLPHLIILVDELFYLIKENPDFVAELIDISQRGRSLGIHLILGTQKPRGVINDDIRANMTTAFCFKMNNRTDSQDILENDLATKISKDNPGEGIIKSEGQLISFKAIISNLVGKYERDEIEVYGLDDFEEKKIAFPKREIQAGVSDKKIILENINQVVETLKFERPRIVYHPSLPLIVTNNDSLREGVNEKIISHIISLGDDYCHQQIKEFTFKNFEKNLLIFGANQSGKSNLLKNLILNAPPEYSFVVIGREKMFQTQAGRAYNVVQEITFDEIDELFRFFNLAEQKSKQVIILEDLNLFAEKFGMRNDNLNFVNDLYTLLGKNKNIFWFTSNEATKIPNKINSLVEDRLVFHLNNENDYGMFSIAKEERSLLVENIPGRMFWQKMVCQNVYLSEVEEEVEVQILNRKNKTENIKKNNEVGFESDGKSVDKKSSVPGFRSFMTGEEIDFGLNGVSLVIYKDDNFGNLVENYLKKNYLKKNNSRVEIIKGFDKFSEMMQDVQNAKELNQKIAANENWVIFWNLLDGKKCFNSFQELKKVKRIFSFDCYEFDLNGLVDWVLPKKNELNDFRKNRGFRIENGEIELLSFDL